MHPLLKLVSGVAKGIHAHHKAQVRLAHSLTGEERELAHFAAQLHAGFFERPMGVLAITTKALRFEKSLSAMGRATSGALEIPLSIIRSVTAAGAGLFGGKVTLMTDNASWTFAFVTSSRAQHVRDVITAACKGE